jgi:hypothetical protein
MIRRYSILTILLLAVSAFSADGDFLRKKSLELLDAYCPDGSRIVRMCLPLYPESTDKEFTSMIDGTDEAACVNAMNTVVHEENHSANTFMGRDVLKKRFKRFSDVFYEYDYYYLRDGRFVLMTKTPTFPSIEMVPDFPARLRTFRFDTYVNTRDSIQSTQVHGAYGLLDEMNSYYQGTKASFDLLGWYEKKGRDAEWHDWFQGVNGTLYGCLEFRLYILKYLQFAKKHHAGVYWTLLGNRAWCYAFLEVDRNVSDLIMAYDKAKPGVFKRLAGYGWTVSEDDSYVSITKAGRATRHMSFANVLKLLADEMKKPEYAETEKAIREWAGDWDPESVYAEVQAGMAGETEDASGEYDAEAGAYEPKEPENSAEPENSSEPEEPSEPPSGGGYGAAVTWKTGGFTDPSGDAGRGFIDLTSASMEKAGKSLVIRIGLAAYPEKLSFCQRGVPENGQEYRWAAFLDLDGDGTDDRSVELGFFKMPGCSPVQGDPLTRAQAAVWDIEGDSGSLSETQVRVSREGKGLRLEIPSCPWISSVGSRTKIRFETYCTDGTNDYSDRLPD